MIGAIERTQPRAQRSQPSAPDPRERETSVSFALALGAGAGGATRRLSPEQQARHAAEDFVSLALIQPILQELRSQNDAAPPFAPGDAERTFGAMFDAEIARRIVKRADYALVNEVARTLLRGQQTGANAPPPRAGSIDHHA